MKFTHFRNSRTRSGNHLVLLVKANNAHKERFLPQTIIAFKKYKGGLKHSQK